MLWINCDRFERAVEGDCYSDEGMLNSNDVDIATDFKLDVCSCYLARLTSQSSNEEQRETSGIKEFLRTNPFFIMVDLRAGGQFVEIPYYFVDEVLLFWMNQRIDLSFRSSRKPMKGLSPTRLMTMCFDTSLDLILALMALLRSRVWTTVWLALSWTTVLLMSAPLFFCFY